MNEPPAPTSDLFEQYEAQVRSYCRRFPAIFASARGTRMADVLGHSYIDFFMGAGALNYGHNHPQIKRQVIDYLERDGVVHGLDMYTAAKHQFISQLYEIVLRPRDLGHMKVTFPGPTGTNAIETALKIARRATGRQGIIAFTNGFHGMTLGSLALTADRGFREAAGTLLSGVTRLPFDGYLDQVDTAGLLRRMLSDPGSGLDLPAAVILETVQAEGGLNVASAQWLRDVAAIAAEHGVLLIVDEIQSGCGRTGRFLSFEDAGITPDIICMSKSLSALGLPLSMVLFDPRYDVLQPGEHSGTFRGHNLAFVAGAAGLELWRDPAFAKRVDVMMGRLSDGLRDIVARRPGAGAHLRGKGALIGIGWDEPTMAARVSQAAFGRGLLIETCGPHGEVLKLLPPLTVDEAELDEGLARLDLAVGMAAENRS